MNEIEIDNVTLDAVQAKEAAKISIDFLAAIAIPLVYRFAFPETFKTIWSWLLTNSTIPRAFPKLALGLPRGFSKTTVIKLFILWCILFSSKKCIVITAATGAMAENILSDVMDMLEETNIKRLFGDWRIGVEKDTQDKKMFSFCGRAITICAIGAQGSLRGLNLKNERPDLIIFEDIQSRECADSEKQSMDLERWMFGTAMKSKSPFGCTYIFVANMYPTEWSLLKRLKKNKTWTKFIAGGILADGTSLWEELHPISQLMEEYQSDLESGHPEIFFSEVLNDENAKANNLIDLSLLPPIPMMDGDTPAGKFIIIDPASGKGKDEISIGYFEVHEGLPVLMEVKEDSTFSPADTIKESLEIALRKDCRVIAVESNAYQSTLCFWFDFITNQLGIVGIEAVEVFSGGRAKNARIIDMLKAYSSGDIFIHPEARPPAHAQITAFQPLRTDNTDGILDLLTYAPKVMELYGPLIQSFSVITLQEAAYQEVLPEQYNSSF